ncbi:hypothetical protein ACFYKX_11010 [Cytobacillus sp. FJAT-54145]|uniref:Uncharacterized protein n=1 Tax=Cytobacillus spartinae TaxID=3299023 RepID=A0ABW6KE95_9BACI
MNSAQQVLKENIETLQEGLRLLEKPTLDNLLTFFTFSKLPKHTLKYNREVHLALMSHLNAILEPSGYQIGEEKVRMSGTFDLYYRSEIPLGNSDSKEHKQESVLRWMGQLDIPKRRLLYFPDLEGSKKNITKQVEQLVQHKTIWYVSVEEVKQEFEQFTALKKVFKAKRYEELQKTLELEPTLTKEKEKEWKDREDLLLHQLQVIEEELAQYPVLEELLASIGFTILKREEEESISS